MSIYQVSKDDIAAMISTAIGATVTSSQFDITGIRPAVSGDNVSKNTKLHFKMNATGNYSGECSIYYDRLDLASLANFSPYSVNGIRKAPVYTGDNLYNIFPQIRDALGIQFTTDDLEAATVTQGTYGSEVVLTAKAGAPGWTGAYTLRLSGYPNIITALYNAVLGGF